MIKNSIRMAALAIAAMAAFSMMSQEASAQSCGYGGGGFGGARGVSVSIGGGGIGFGSGYYGGFNNFGVRGYGFSPVVPVRSYRPVNFNYYSGSFGRGFNSSFYGRPHHHHYRHGHGGRRW